MTVLDDERLIESGSTSTEADNEPTHLVCHCTNDNMAACGLDVSDIPLGDTSLDLDNDPTLCPLCMLVWPLDAPTCPWGCRDPLCDQC